MFIAGLLGASSFEVKFTLALKPLPRLLLVKLALRNITRQDHARCKLLRLVYFASSIPRCASCELRTKLQMHKQATFLQAASAPNFEAPTTTSSCLFLIVCFECTRHARSQQQQEIGAQFCFTLAQNLLCFRPLRRRRRRQRLNCLHLLEASVLRLVAFACAFASASACAAATFDVDSAAKRASRQKSFRVHRAS